MVARIRANGGRVLVFGHGHSLRALTARWIEQPVDEGRFFKLDTATVSTLGYERDFPVVRPLEQLTGHLPSPLSVRGSTPQDVSASTRPGAQSSRRTSSAVNQAASSASSPARTASGSAPGAGWQA